MFLESLEIFGFKSFAEKTSIVFEPGITAVVGPNGCGKSNIVDAIKWVLGEKQAKNIRGEKMEDVIFSGTENRKPVSLAEVSITINNAERILPIDSDSVTITRRVFRDGESEYMINKSPVRLKDIEALFMDTGIGKSSYSVMEQGKIDLILSTRAEDRRYLFEEAAGISRFKFQKRESLRKLEETGHNLERINDIVKEIEREKDAKARQAEKTKAYLSLMAEFKECDIRQNALKHADLSRRRARLEAEIEKLKGEREEISAKTSLLSAENERDEKQKNDIQLELFELDKKLHTYRIKVEDIDSRAEKNRSLIGEERARHAAIERNIKELGESLAHLEEERRRGERSGVEIQRKIEEDRERLSSIFEMRKRKIASIQEARERIEKNRGIIRENEERLKSLRGSLELVVQRLIDAIEKRKAELASSEEERLALRARINERIAGVRALLRSALDHLTAGRAPEAREALEGIDLDGIERDITRFEGIEDGFRSILFDKTGVHAEKERLDAQIAAIMQSSDSLGAENISLDERIKAEQAEIEDINAMIMKIEKDLSKNENERAWIEKHLKSLASQARDIEHQIEIHGAERARAEKSIQGLEKEISEWESRLIEFNERSESLKKDIREFTDKREDIEKRIEGRRDASKKDSEALKRLLDRIGEQEKLLVELVFRINGIEEYLWTEYEKKIGEVRRSEQAGEELSQMQGKMQDLKKRIQDLGPVNNLAIEEYKELKKRFEYYIGQKKDIEKAREDIVSVIQDINKTSVELFVATFSEIQKNFSDIFKRLFEGGNAALELTDPENVLESGIEIYVRPPGKKLKSINLLSGGERALTAIALLFATYMVKPSPFCFLDEIDAPLDEENIGRFVRMLLQFSRNSQFIIVTHNKKTMSIGGSIYGVTMEEAGVSKVVSLRMEKKEKQAVR